MHFIGLSLFVILAMQSWQLGESECCKKTIVKFDIRRKDDCHNYLKSTRMFLSITCKNRLCNDLSANSICCGVGSCNAFCCECDGGCLKGDIAEQMVNKFGKDITLLEPKPKKSKESSDDLDNLDEDSAILS
ncbi:protein Diedel-like [Drosophila nasuta]|uniref:protein Diedel-like n=1 Tax=Drosophila nasuta TaxID=42062 RepID=UPI00295ECA4E|nr:protein Diedel-like [Drosophila nasuta]